MQFALSRIAELVGGKVEGDLSSLITGVAGIREAGPGDLTFLANRKYRGLLESTHATAVIVAEGYDGQASCALIRVKSPDLAFARVIELFAPPPEEFPRSVDALAVVGQDVHLGENVSVQALTVIADGVHIGDNTTIYSNIYIGSHSRIGRDCLIYPNVVIRERVTLGDRVIIHAGAVVGSDGFGFVAVDGVHHKIPQIGTVEIGDDVEIGANVTIDRARFDKTVIGAGTKIDNLVQIAHNVVIGENTIIVAQVAVAGSTTVGDNVTIGGQSALDGHIHIGDNVAVAAKSGVTKDIPSNTYISGFPAQSHDKDLKDQARLRRLPDLQRRVKELEERIADLAGNAEDHSCGA